MGSQVKAISASPVLVEVVNVSLTISSRVFVVLLGYGRDRDLVSSCHSCDVLLIFGGPYAEGIVPFGLESRALCANQGRARPADID